MWKSVRWPRESACPPRAEVEGESAATEHMGGSAQGSHVRGAGKERVVGHEDSPYGREQETLRTRPGGGGEWKPLALAGSI